MYRGRPGTSWLERMRTTPVLSVARALGIEHQPPRGSSGGALTCPACNAPRRHTKSRDKRAAAGVRGDGQGWHCFQCTATGDALDVIAFHLRGKRLSELGGAGKDEVRDWCVRWLGLPDHESWRSSSSPGIAGPHARTPQKVEPLRRYPPYEEVCALWRSAERVVADPEICAWLQRDRGLEPQAIAALDLVRALPVTNATTLPRWAGFGGEGDKPWRAWPSVGLRLLVPLFDCRGVMRSVLFRRAFETQSSWPPKSIGTNGFERAGLVMANAVGCHLLAHTLREIEPIGIVIEEGEIDWLTGCLAWASQNQRAIFGVTSGSWTTEIAQRLPRDARVTIRVDNDAAGDKLAGAIAETLHGRCRVLRGGQRSATA